MLSKLTKRGQLLTLFRAGFAALVDHISVTKSKKKTNKMVLPPDYQKTGCVSSGWDREAYERAKLNLGSKI
jgi:hypothetical protein